jgi:TRAP-type C4-dicarboxylate transport system permease small subunit
MEEKKDFLDELAQTVMVIMIVIASVLMLLSFVLQFISPEAKTLVTQLAFYAYGWMVFCALGPCVKRGAFMRIELLTNKYPKGVQTGLKLFSEVVLFLLMVMLCVLSIQNLLNAVSTGATNASAPVIPLALAYAAPVVGYALAVIAYIRKAMGAKKGDAK